MAGKSLEPAITHLMLDGERIETTPEHSFYTRERGWVDAGDLQLGDHIRQANGEYGVVQAVEVEQRPQVMYNLTDATAHTFFVGDGRWLVHNDACGDSTPTHLYAFGNRSGPRPPRAGTDVFPDQAGMLTAESPPFPRGASTFGDPNVAPFTGHYHKLPSNTPLPQGLGVVADGRDVLPGSPHDPTHHTLYPTEPMHIDRFTELFRKLPWEYAGKK